MGALTLLGSRKRLIVNIEAAEVNETTTPVC